jgi:predicted helicase
MVERGLLDDMRPQPFQNGEWLNLREAFTFSKSGMKSGNDDVFVSPIRARLRSQVEPVISARADPAYDASLEKFYSYRPFDRRWFFNDLRLLNRPGPAMQRVWGAENVGLYALPSGTGAGPGVWCHGLVPDYHAFRGSYGGYAFPLYDHRPNIAAPNISPALIESLSAAYGEPVAAESVFDAIVCLLSATSYTLRFAEDLEDVFPHVPFPAQYVVFQNAVRAGREIREIETYARRPDGAYRQADFARVSTEPRGTIASVEYADSSITLCGNGSGRITGLPQSVWDFSVSGYRVLPRWLEARIGLPAELALVQELRENCGRIAELIDLFAEADILLEATLQKR